jgi:hypothetical protein
VEGLCRHYLNYVVCTGASQRDVVSLEYAPKCGGGGGVEGSQLISTSVHVEPK